MSHLLQNTLQDLRFALRQLRRSPGFTLGVTGVLALGIGANAGMFTVLEATLVRPLPYLRPGNLVTLSVRDTAGKPSFAYLADILAWRDRSHTTTDVAYFDFDPSYLGSSTDLLQAQRVMAVSASANLFSTLGTGPALGRAFLPSEQLLGSAPVAVLSDTIWRTQFHADPSLLGKTVRLNDIPTTVIGIMPRGFVFPADQPAEQIWTPVALDPKTLARKLFESPSFNAVARLAPGSTSASVATELSTVQHSLLPIYTDPDNARFAPASVTATPYRQSLTSADQRSALLALLSAVGVLWFIACANVAGLTLARSASRRRELAVRSALGASRWNLIRQNLVESFLLASLGAGTGLSLAAAALRLFAHRLTTELGTRFTGGIGTELPLTPDTRVLLALVALTLLSALLFSLVPSLLASRIPVEQALRQDGQQSGTSRSQHRLQRSLIVGELALTLALLVACGLLLRTVLALQHVPLGFRTDHVYVISPNLPSYRYAKLDPNSTVYKPLLYRLSTLPGVQSTAITTVAPLDKSFRVTFTLTKQTFGEKGVAASHTITAQLRAAGPELQQVLGFRMRRGRYFNASDNPDSQPVAVVNQAFANLYAEGGDDIGNFSLGSDGRAFKVVGILDDFHQRTVADPAEPELDFNAAQLRPTDAFYQPTLKAHAEILLRSPRSPASLLPELRHALSATNPDLAAANIQTMDQIVEDSIGSQLLAAHLLETLGALALLIALAGLYSLLAYLVTLRTRELGLRLALGAQRSDILTLVLRNAATLLLTGIAAGLALSLAAARLLRSFLFGVHPHDPLTLIAAPLLLLTVGLLAAFLPARRAAHLEPTTALRSE